MFGRSRRYSKPGADTAKWRRMPHSGVGVVFTEADAEWEIRVTHRQAGSSIRRNLFSASIRCAQTKHEEFLLGFRSKLAAIEAARRRITMLKSLAKRAAQRRSATRKRLRDS